ncbi:AraC family transcriptional regulator [Aquabacterium sp.]|jgi:AraC-like DNA-binding protein|uniref:AraC family transcriptional regulator n=1 Tax=Aquabacterium sp. TaxID=1872578 RepID=UPI001D3061C2|nr:AraC family transcriptional regulator [Aquabacterium sp.]MBT9609940.1 AraC family transcriptional regulator [Aquabacterium sp.]|tara:strand:+ start:1387 stop:2382 length:996 start_codon:yes stop_codon:yes gene_type:complete
MADTRIAASFAQLLHEYLDRQGLDARQLLGPQPDPSQHFLPMADWQAWLKRVDAIEGRVGLGLRIAEGISARHFGVLGYAALACNNLADALQRMERYHASVYDANPAHVEVLPDGVVVEWGVERGRPGALVDETAIASLVQLARDMTGHYWPMRKVSFVNPPPADVQPYRDFFGCEVLFNAPTTRLEFDTACLALPMRKSDPALAQLLDQQAEQVLRQVSQVPAIVDAWRRTLVPLIREGQTSLAALARAHHTSPRTLQRRLSEQGLSFQQLLDDTRRHLAEAHLKDARLDLAEIALLLGYSEQSAFTRAFRVWTGLPPAQWRKQNRLKKT